jgi:acyl dehydratase
MPLNPSIVGRTYSASTPYEVTLVKVREFAAAIGDENLVYRDADAARGAGLPAVIAPPTFAYVVGLASRRTLLDDPELGLTYSRAVHGEQRFVFERPIRVGDLLTARCQVTSVKVRGPNEILAWCEEILDAEGDVVCTNEGTIVSRGTATESL